MKTKAYDSLIEILVLIIPVGLLISSIWGNLWAFLFLEVATYLSFRKVINEEFVNKFREKNEEKIKKQLKLL